MTVQFSVRMLAGGKELDARLVPLLRAISSTGSLNQAVAALRLSYRYAWGLLGKATDVIGQPLVVMERGRGAKLSLLGEKLVAADQAANRMLAHELAGTAEDLNREVAASRRHPVRPLVIHASHDLALASLRDQISDSKDLALDLHFRGSLECLPTSPAAHAIWPASTWPTFPEERSRTALRSACARWRWSAS